MTTPKKMFRVLVQEIDYYHVWVEADSAEQAKESWREQADEGNYTEASDSYSNGFERVEDADIEEVDPITQKEI